MDLAEDLGRLLAEDLDDHEFSFLRRWQKQKLMESSKGSGSASRIDMYKNDVGKRFMKYKGTLTSATLYFTS